MPKRLTWPNPQEQIRAAVARGRFGDAHSAERREAAGSPRLGRKECIGPGSQEAGKVLSRKGVAEQEALPDIAFVIAQEL
jgi:hypothetical protein